MSEFRPYMEREFRVVSDLSRFEFESLTPRNRSRNTTPTSIDNNSSQLTLETIIPPLSSSINRGGTRNLIDIAEQSNVLSNSKPRDKVRPPKPIEKDNAYIQNEIYKYYMIPSISTINENNEADGKFVPYPVSINGNNTQGNVPQVQYNGYEIAIPRDPSTHSSPLNKSNETLYNNNNDLPKMTEPKDYKQSFGKEESFYEASVSELQSNSSRQKRLEMQLIKKVMNKPLFSVPTKNFIGSEKFQGKELTISSQFIFYIFEIIFEIIIIVLSSVLLNKDEIISKEIYRYFIASGVISLCISLLFITTIINFEKRNGSFYCLTAAILTLVSFIMVISHLLPNSVCLKQSVCSTRKAVGAFIIISTFMWITNLAMFLTTLYISRLNLLNDINFDYGDKGIESEFNKSKEPAQQNDTQRFIDPYSGQLLKQYHLNENGEMYEINDSMEVRNKNKIIVYTN